MIGLLGSLFIFLIGMPGRSETWVSSSTAVARHIVQLILVFLGLAVPMSQTAVIQPVKAPVHIQAPAANMIKKPVITTKPMADSMMFRVDPHLHRYNYIFEGKASFHGQPYANASVLVRLESGDVTTAKGGVTEADGSYRIEVAIDAADQSPVDWTVDAYTSDFDKVELAGRRIVQKEEESLEPITVTTPVEFQVSLSK